MGEALWRRWCLWRLCLVAAAAAAAAAEVAAAAAEVAAGQQAACEVLDSRVQFTFPLPTNLTLRPSGRQWWVDFVLQQTDQQSTVCVNVKQDTSKVKLKLIEGTCGGVGEMIDYGFIKDVTVLPHAWTTLSVEVMDNEVLVASSGSAPVALQGGDTPLPRDALQVVGAQDVKVAVGCRVNCPHHKYSTDRGEKMNVLVTQQEDVVFYFHPGEHFTRLEYEVECATPLGLVKYLHITDIKPPFPGRWYVVELQHRSGVARLTLNNEPLQDKPLPPQCVFKGHTVRIIQGQALFSFSCNPVSGAPEWEGIESMAQCGGNTCSVKDQATTASVAVVITVVLAVVFGVVLYCCVLQTLQERARRKQMTTFSPYGDTCPLCKHKAGVAGRRTRSV